MSQTTADALNDILSVLKGGAEFYRKGAGTVSDPKLSKIFVDHASERETAASELASRVSSSGDEPSSGSWAEKAASWYASSKALVADDAKTMISELEEHEDRTLEAFRKAIGEIEPQDAETASILNRQLAKFRETHDRMKALKKAA